MASHPELDPTAKGRLLDFATYALQYPRGIPTDDELLKTPIHPLLARNNFSSISDDDYELMKPSLRFVTTCFKHDEVCKYVDTMVNGVYYHDSNDQKHRGGRIDLDEFFQLPHDRNNLHPQRRLCYPDPAKSDIEGIRKRAAAVFDDLVPRVDFVVFRARGNNRNRDGTARTVRKSKWPSIAGDKFPPTCRSRIALNRDILNKLRAEILMEASDPQSRQRYLMQLIRLGRLILHEISHAIQHAVWGPRWEEAYYRNSIFSEAGLQMEAVLFGGLTNTLDCKNGKVVNVVHVWPSPGYLSLYGCIKAPFGARGKIESVTVCHALQMEAYLRILTDNFWTPEAMRRPLFPTDTPSWICGCQWDGKFTPMFNTMEAYGEKMGKVIRSLKGETDIDFYENWGDLFDD